MPATGRSARFRVRDGDRRQKTIVCPTGGGLDRISRRVLMLGGLAALAADLRADSADQVWERIGALASALTNGDGGEFLSAFDRAMPGFEELRNNVTALLGQAEVQSSIELVSNEGDDRKRVVEADWILRMIRRDSVSGAAKREERVKAGFEKQGKSWRIVSFAPLGFFAPPQTPA